MNRGHRWLCRSSGWKKTLEERVLPSVVKDPDLGENVLEGGPGLTTGWLRQRLNRLTAVEIDREMEGSLASRMHGTNVRLIRDDGTAAFQRGFLFGGRGLHDVSLHSLRWTPE
ncbi:MAG TPA: hypothetical protein VJW77_16160 [Terriglobia bacterium]|nr:hypothetical protein [Terriglobia bacterium]